MSTPSHNAILPFPMTYRGEVVGSFSELWDVARSRSRSNEGTVNSRMRIRLAHEAPSDELLDECLLLDSDEYRRRYGVRRTFIETDHGRMDVRTLHENQNGPIPYSTFRTRLKRLEEKGNSIGARELRAAATFDFTEWRTAYGGRKGGEFHYDGEIYPDAVGWHTSFNGFLRAVGRYDDRDTLKQRKRSFWDIDDLLREPIANDGMPGYIYKITNTVTGRVYVGLSVNTPQVRFNQHVMSARKESGSLLHQDMQKLGEGLFELNILEEVPATEDGISSLAEREIFWIAKLGTLAPAGYNTLEGGQLGRYNGTAVSTPWGDFRSIAEMGRVVGKQKGLPPYVMLRCWREGRPLPDKARKHSKHPEAGSEPFRQWLGIWKRAEQAGDAVDLRWADYDCWKADIETITGEGRLTRADENLPWGPANVIRMSRSEIVERTHGKELVAFNRRWPVQQHAFAEFGIPRNVFGWRIKHGWSVEDALATPLGPTSKTPITFEDENFESQSAAARILGERHGIHKESARDYIRREVPTSDWPKNGVHHRQGMGIRQVYTIDDIHYASKKAVARAFGLSPGGLDKRHKKLMKEGLSDQEAMAQAVKTPLADATISIFGYDWTSAKAACAVFGLADNTYRARVETHGMTPEEAILTPTARGYAGHSREEAIQICRLNSEGLTGSSPE